jgi:hypothetical protein
MRIGKIKPLFTQAHLPASPRLAPLSPLEVPLSRRGGSPASAGRHRAATPGRVPGAGRPAADAGREGVPHGPDQAHGLWPGGRRAWRWRGTPSGSPRAAWMTDLKPRRSMPMGQSRSSRRSSALGRRWWNGWPPSWTLSCTARGRRARQSVRRRVTCTACLSCGRCGWRTCVPSSVSWRAGRRRRQPAWSPGASRWGVPGARRCGRRSPQGSWWGVTWKPGALLLTPVPEACGMSTFFSVPPRSWLLALPFYMTSWQEPLRLMKLLLCFL